MRLIALSLLVLAALTIPALACRPLIDNRAYIERAAEEKSLFLGKITALDDSSITFDVLASHGTPAIGTSITKPRSDYGTCGSLSFAVGDVWLYVNDWPYGISLKPTRDDLGADNGADIEALIKRVGQRLNPGYVAPVPPTKETAIIPGHYSHSQTCGDAGNTTANYDLTISPLDAATNLYTVNIKRNDCSSPDTICNFTGTAAPYGYGELVVTPPGQTACSLLIVQNEKGTDVDENNSVACSALLDCKLPPRFMASDYLQKAE